MRASATIGSWAQVGGDLGGRPVPGFDVGAGVAEEADGAQVHQRRPPVPTRHTHRLRNGLGGAVRIVAVGGDVGDTRPRAASSTQPFGEATEMPRPLSSQTNTSGSGRPCCTQYPAVFSAPTAVEWLMLCVAETADGDGVLGPARSHAQSSRTVDGEGHAHGAR